MAPRTYGSRLHDTVAITEGDTKRKGANVAQRSTVEVGGGCGASKASDMFVNA
jgi:hypothetical protein